MSGILTFPTLAEALRAGYMVEDKTEYGYLMRIRTSAGFARAIVVLRAA